MDISSSPMRVSMADPYYSLKIIKGNKDIQRPIKRACLPIVRNSQYLNLDQCFDLD